MGRRRVQERTRAVVAAIVVKAAVGTGGEPTPWLSHRWGDVWLTDHRLAAPDVTAPTLPPAITQRAARFVGPDDTRHYLQAHRAVHRVLSTRVAPLDPSTLWQVGTHGKPTLSHGPAFNLSRRGAWVGFIVGVSGDVALGIDIEPMRMVPDATALARAHFTPTEMASLQQGSLQQRSRAFLQVWTRKEAAVKAVGSGLSIAPSTFHVGLGDAITTTLESATHRYRVEVESLAHQTVVLAVARVVALSIL